MTHRIAIIGAGMGGLAAALKLSGRPGLQITLFEAADHPGGKVGVAHYEGVHFDTGPSLLTLPTIAADLFADRGFDLADELPLVKPDPIARYHFPDGTSFQVGENPQQTEENIRTNLGSEAALEFRSFLGYSRRIWEAAAPYFVMDKAPSVLTPLSMGISAIKAFRDIDSTSTMYDAICRRVADPRLRSVFLRYATFNGSDPRRAPATLNCISWVDLGLGGHGVRGGMFELAKTLERLARQGGVEFQYDCPIRSITTNAGGFLLDCDGRQFEAHRVVVNADVRHLVDDLWREEVPKKLRSTPPLSTSGWNAVLRARRRDRSRRVAHEIIFPDRDYLEEFVDLFDRDIPPKKPTIYLCAREKAHQASGWEEHEPLFLMTNVPACDQGYSPVDWADYEDRIMTRLRSLDFIDHDDRVVWRRTPEHLARRFPGSQGSLYGAASNNRFAAFQRPSNSAPGIPGMYLASGSAHPGGGVPLCIQSGRQAGRELLEDIGL